ncbi:MAG: hypothetical protein EAZ15_02870 [Sphingobacteriales bacterium]|nr:MAG: hypothetical protein EAZ15_02870 [Sphingobacteriales bacterium]
MAVYRFRVSFEDYDEVIREIDIKSVQTFKDLHFAIHQATGYTPEKPSSFYVSNDQWIKNEEIAYLPSDKKSLDKITLMEDAKLSRFIDDPHQKFYYIYNFEKPFEFHVQLIKILENNPNAVFPSLFKSVGEAPRITPVFLDPEDVGIEDDVSDLFDDDDATIADDDELSELKGVEGQPEDEESEENEFGDEFADNEGFDEDDYKEV